MKNGTIEFEYEFGGILSTDKYLRYENLSDQEIWAEYLNEKDDALEYIYIKHVNELFRFGKQIIKNRDLVKDCIQNLFINLKTNRNTSVKVLSIKSYLYKSLYRKIQYEIRRESSFARNTINPFNSIVENDPSVETKIVNEEKFNHRKELMSYALNQLSSKQLQAILLYFYDGFTYEEISGIMQLKNKSSARKLLHRALDALKKSVSIVLYLLTWY